MYSCSFFGDIRAEDMSMEFKSVLYGALEFLIWVKGIEVFYTTSSTDFDRVCEKMILDLKDIDSSVTLVKIVGNDYKNTEEDNAFDKMVKTKCTDYASLCKSVSDMSDYIIFDMIEEGIGQEIFVEKLFGKHPKGIFDISRIVRNHKIKVER